MRLICIARAVYATGVCLTLATASPGAAAGQSGSVPSLSAQSNIFRAAGNAPTLDGVDPFGIMITAMGTGRLATFSATGAWNCCSGVGGWQGPDGGFTGNPPTNINSWNQIAGIAGPMNMWLVGVFLGPSLPAGPPARRIYSASDYSTSLFSNILLGQTFFIGDGMTGTGSGIFQSFLVPDGANRLYLGLVDGGSFQGDPGAYIDNVGALSVSWTIVDGDLSSVVPEPATFVLLGTGLLMLVAGSRRHSWRKRKG